MVQSDITISIDRYGEMPLSLLFKSKPHFTPQKQHSSNLNTNVRVTGVSLLLKYYKLWIAIAVERINSFYKQNYLDLINSYDTNNR